MDEEEIIEDGVLKADDDLLEPLEGAINDFRFDEEDEDTNFDKDH